jgi:hypothetical protein
MHREPRGACVLSHPWSFTVLLLTFPYCAVLCCAAPAVVAMVAMVAANRVHTQFQTIHALAD